MQTSAPQATTPDCRDLPLVCIRQTTLTWGDILAGAEFLGLLEPVIDGLARRDALCALASEQGLEPDPELAQTVATQWRYHFDLITARETEVWLTERQLDVADLQAFVRRTVLAQQAAEQLPGGEAPAAPWQPDDPVRELWCEALFRDLLPALVKPIARRAVVSLAMLNEDPVPKERETRHREAWQDRAADARFLRGDPAPWPAWEAAFDVFRERVAHPEHCARGLADLRPKLFIVEFETGVFAHLDAAREAVCCVTLDQEPLADVCARAPGEYKTTNVRVGDLDNELGQALLSARPGEVLDPIVHEDGPASIHRLIRKREPEEGDPEVHDRLVEHLLCEELSPHLENEVSWPRWPLAL